MKALSATITLGLVFSCVLIGTSPASNACMQPLYSARIAQYNASQKEVILQVPEINEKNFSAVRQNIEATGGMTYKGFCKELKVLLYVMDTGVHNDYTFLDTAFANVSLTYLLKEGTIAQVEAVCDMPATATPDQN